ncbi:MAG: preprotein translocase subunit SecA [Caldiserica bacterium]|jgi:preprotein translocase subunit SecA|nr:preprotein translocase subunit SecA [Caldisericota bacterium]MDH7562874.1 preprotein translocase subunit SecA [Caldisericota bacterium]
MIKILKNLLSSNERELNRYWQVVQRINQLEPKFRDLTPEEAPPYTEQFKKRLSSGETLEDILPEAFALVREISPKTIGLRHFDVQLIGGIVLHEGKIAEMKTGEGKTLVATLAAYLNALEGKGVHIVTVNDYLAKRDRNWMGPLYEALGLKVGLILHDSSISQRKEAYASDITYGTNNEFGFDYLRDNMAIDIEHTVQRELNYAIIDEVDSILIDEARTPLIISGPAEESTDLYYRAAQAAKRLIEGEDFETDEKAKTVSLTPQGAKKVERYLGLNNLYASENVEYLRHINAALKAMRLFKRDVDYIVKDGEVVIVDEFTGRLMFGRRYSDGLHQAIEAKEGLRVRQENQTLATITFQNYFRMYRKIAGMTGTAATEEEEFRAIYNLPVVVIPTNKPMIREDFSDVIYKTEKAKFRAIVNEIKELYQRKRPVLVGTRSIEKSEILSRMLSHEGIPHQVLNAKYHEKEAEIIARAGQPGAVTIATNMAGRGVDIVLGEGVAAMGGLHIIGTERHESRRIDNQLRGRAGRQGDPGSSRFYLSLEDELLRIFGGSSISNFMERLKFPEDTPIEHSLLTRAIENAQKKVEAHNFEIRKQLLEFDNVLNKQREVIYAERKKVMEEENLKEHILEMLNSHIDELADLYMNPHGSRDQWDSEGFLKAVEQLVASPLTPPEEELSRTALIEWGKEVALRAYLKKEEEISPELMRQVERFVLLRTIDMKWKDQLYSLDFLKEGIGLRAYGQKSPLLEYQFEAYEMFQDMLRRIKEDTLKFLFRVQLKPQGAPEPPSREKVAPVRSQGQRNPPRPSLVGSPASQDRVSPQSFKGVGRNDPCPCGSGLKFKKCHGKNQ